MKAKNMVIGTLGTLATALAFSVSAQTSSTAPTITEGAPPPPAQTPQQANKDTSYPQGVSQSMGQSQQGSTGMNHSQGTSTGGSQGMSQPQGTWQGVAPQAPRNSGSAGGEDATKMPHPPKGAAATGATETRPGEPGHTTSQRGAQGTSQPQGTVQGTASQAPRNSGSAGGEDATKMPHPPKGAAGATETRPGEPGHTTAQDKK